MKLQESFIPKFQTSCRPGILIPSKKIESITIHWIGPYPGQSVHTPVAYWVQNKLECSAHWIVKDDLALNVIPMNEVAWHCASVGNYSSIGIEVVPANKEGEFGPITVETLHELIRYIEAKFSRKLELKRHYDWTKKSCPLYYTPDVEDGEEHWDKLITF